MATPFACVGRIRIDRLIRRRRTGQSERRNYRAAAKPTPFMNTPERPRSGLSGPRAASESGSDALGGQHLPQALQRFAIGGGPTRVALQRTSHLGGAGGTRRAVRGLEFQATPIERQMGE